MTKADISVRVLCHILIILALTGIIAGNEDAKRLLEELFDGYSPIARPVADENDIITLKLGLKLSQIADIDEKNQIMTTNVWLRHEWSDYKLTWNPEVYGNTTKINIPSSDIWLPDVVLYNNADGDYQITTKTKATIHYDGKIIWEPPMIYKSYCAINIEYYPFDIQDCYMKFGTWTFDGTLINMHHVTKNDSLEEIIPNKNQVGLGSVKMYTVEMGIDLSDYYQSVEWDILSIPAQKNIKYYDCCDGPYYDIYFNITIRRKTLFYTVNLIIPCVNISFLSVLVFYLPSDSGEKLTLGISILVALLVFYLLLIDLIPPTSLVIPLLGKYLLFTLVLVNLSILLTIFVLNLHHRKPNTHKMPHWMKVVFIDFLPKYLLMERPKPEKNKVSDSVDYEDIRTKMNLQYYHQPFVPNTSCLSDQQLEPTDNILLRLKRRITFKKSLSRERAAAAAAANVAEFEVEANHNNSLYLRQAAESMMKNVAGGGGGSNSESPLPKMLKKTKTNESRYPESIRKALRGIKYLNKQTKVDSAERKEIDDWKYVSMVIDRLLLYVFTTACLIGTFGILLQAPSIYDERQELKKPPTLTYN